MFGFTGSGHNKCNQSYQNSNARKHSSEDLSSTDTPNWMRRIADTKVAARSLIIPLPSRIVAVYYQCAAGGGVRRVVVSYSVPLCVCEGCLALRARARGPPQSRGSPSWSPWSGRSSRRWRWSPWRPAGASRSVTWRRSWSRCDTWWRPWVNSWSIMTDSSTPP